MGTYRVFISEDLEHDSTVVEAALKITSSYTYFDVIGDPSGDDEGSIYVFKEFAFTKEELESFKVRPLRILGAAAFVKLASNFENEGGKLLEGLTRPLFCLSMQGVIFCFTGLKRAVAKQLYRCLVYMGGTYSEKPDLSTTHLIGHNAGSKIGYGDTFDLPVMAASWVTSAWDRRHDRAFYATSSDFVSQHKLKFGGLRVCFLGFTEEETEYMNKTLVSHNGITSLIDDPLCTHLVVDEVSSPPIPDNLPRTCKVVKALWFWTSVQNEVCVTVDDYLINDNGHDNDRGTQTPGSAASRARKRKRLQQLVARQSASPAECKRRSSFNLLENSGSFLDYTLTPEKDIDGNDNKKDGKPANGRYHKFLELVHTESNYVKILKVIVDKFKTPLEDMLEKGNPILDAMELRIIFGNLPVILETHSAMLAELKAGEASWRSFSIGNIILNKAPELIKAYPPFVNCFEKSKEALETCEAKNPRFHAFLKIRQSEPECARQSLKELMIRPVQRMPTINLLIKELIKHTEVSHSDYEPLNAACAAVQKILNHVNEDKKRVEEQLKILEVFNDIENFPAELYSSHRNLIKKAECAELTDGRRGDPVIFHLFTDLVEICCKRRGKTFATLRGSKPRSLQKLSKAKQYKHLRLLPLNNIKMVIDVRGPDELESLFALRVHNSDTLQDALVCFFLCDEHIDKTKFLELLSQQLARIHCTADPDEFIKEMEFTELGLDHTKTSLHSFSKALKFANSAKAKVGRALTLTRTPSRIMHRRAAEAASPAFSQLAQMTLQSCTNLNELGTSSSSRRISLPSGSSILPFL